MLLSGDFDMDKNIKTGAPLKKRLMKYLPLYLLALPSIAYLIINNYMPMSGLILAFKDFSFAKGMWESPWNGLENFSYLFGSKWAVIMFRNTILYNVAFLVLGNVFAILVAILLNEVVSKKAKQVYQTVILIPHLMSMVIIGYLVFAFLSGTNGFINKSILEPLGLEGINWYTEKGCWPVILTIVYLWKDRKRYLGMPLSFTRYALSEDRLFTSVGFLNIRDDEVLLYRIRDIDTRRSLWQRIFGVGTVTVISSDKTMPNMVLKNIKDPMFVKELIHQQVEAVKIKRRVRVGEVMTTDADGDGEPDDMDDPE